MAQYILFADTNVFLDVLLHREHKLECERILKMAEEAKIELFTSPSCLLTVIYILQKSKMPTKDVRKVIAELLSIVFFQPAIKEDFTTALNSNFSDLEDAVQYQAALQIKGIHYFITSNLKDFKNAGELPVIHPTEFVKIVSSNS